LIATNGHAFRKHQRLGNRADYDRVFKKARRSRDKCFTVLARRSENQPARLGLAISKKHCRKASARNRIKRMVRESFRLHQSALTGIDLVVMNQPAAAMATNEELKRSLEAHWQRVIRATSGRTRDPRNDG
jgi:ribonuclease P protein component